MKLVLEKMATGNIRSLYDNSKLSTNMGIYIKRLMADREKDFEAAKEEATIALRRTGVMSENENTIKKKIVSWG